MRAKLACAFVCAMLCLLGVGASVFGQSDVASVTGRVLDPNGAIIIEATVSAKNVDTGVETTVQTNEEGIYRFANLAPGNYEFTVSKHGFKEILKPGVTLHLADTISMNFNMVVGELTEKVTVEAGATMLNTTDASISTVVDQTYIKNMPLNGRSFQDLILLTPGVVTQTPQAGGGFFSGAGTEGEFSVNGQRTESNYYMVDGVSGNVGAALGDGSAYFNTSGPAGSGSVAASTALGTTQALVSVEDLQEFRVSSSTYSAEYGRNPGGQISFQTKSGTNQWHGSGYDYLRNGYFDAQDWFNNYFNTPEPALHQNDFGGTLGGPLGIPGAYNGKDKTFFFVSYEGLRLNAPQPASNNVFVPDAALRASAPAALQPAMNAYPLPTPGGQDFPDGTAQYIASWSDPASLDSASVRFDHTIRDKMKVFFRFADAGSSSTRRGLRSPSTQDTSDYTLRTYTAGATNMFSSRLSNDFRFNYTSNDSNGRSVNAPIGGSSPVDLLQLSGLGPTAQATVLYFNSVGVATSINQARWGASTWQWNLVNTTNLTLGRHQLKFGGDYRRLASSAIIATPSIGYRYFSKSAVANNTPSTQINLNAPGYPLYKNFSAFAQDEWHASQRLTLSMGLRWEVNPPPGVTQGLMPYTLQGSSLDTLAVAPQGTPLWKTTWYNFAPRLGAAYMLGSKAGWETVIRGGGGVFFDSGQQTGSLGFAGVGFFSNNFPGNAAFPSNASALISANNYGITNPPQAPYFPAYGYAPHLQLPYTLQWNASVEQALGKSQALTASFVGSHASRLLGEHLYVDFNNPNTFLFTLIGNRLTADYDSLQLQYMRRLSRGLTALGSYSWSHCIDYGSNNTTLGWQRGNCDYDVRHNFASAFSYDLPNLGRGGVLSALLHHWGFDNRFTARTAFPVNLAGFGFSLPNGQIVNQGLSFVTGKPVFLYGANCASTLQQPSGPFGIVELGPGQGCPGGVALNPNAFMEPTGATDVGNVPRNFARLFGAWQVDMAVRREFPVYENLKLQFRAEAFNVFNHPNFGFVDPGFGDGTFGLATGTLANSLGVLSPLYQMGGPRSMQFALKLIF